MNWEVALGLAKKDQQKFIDKGKKIVKRYRDERGETSTGEKKYNILWSNVRTMFPAVYAKKPKAEVERRNKDKDPIARCASQILERALQYEIDHYGDYDAALKGAVLDRLLPGRGVAWVRFEGGNQITDDAQPEEGAVPAAPPAPVDPKDYECTPTDYVYWEDFRHSPARTWEEVTWVARLVYMGKGEGEKRFGDKFKNVPLVHEPTGIDKDTVPDGGDSLKKAKVWEIWDKSSKTVLWRAEGLSDDLDSKPDPLGLDGFFPCPKPLMATVTTDTLIPIADYLEYQDQAIELDELTTRIGMLVKAVKVVGVYDQSQTGIQRMLNEGVDNTLIPVDTWAMFAERGGIKGSVEFMPIDMVVKALNELYIAREATKQVIYEVTGLSDIIRGSSDAAETATAQQIKSQFGSLRLKESQQEVARFATDLLRMKSQIMADLYRPETLLAMSGIEATEDAQYAQDAVALLKNETMRNFRIDIATDSMVEMDEQAEKASRVEFLQAAGGFLKEAVQAAQMAPELAPLMGEMLMFGVRAFKAGRPLEAAFEQFVAKTNEPKQPKTDPEQMKVQGQLQIEQAKIQSSAQIEQMKMQGTAQIEQIKAQSAAQTAEAQRTYEGELEQARMQMQAQVDNNRQRSEAEQQALKVQNEAQLEQLRSQYEEARHQREMEFERWKFEKTQEQERWKAELEAATQIKTADMAAQVKTNDAATQAATREVAAEVKQPGIDMTEINEATKKILEAAESMRKPRKRTLLRDEKTGKATGSIEEEA